MEEKHPMVHKFVLYCAAMWSIDGAEHVKATHVFGFMMIQRHCGATKLQLQEFLHLICQCANTLRWLTGCIHTLKDTAADLRCQAATNQELASSSEAFSAKRQRNKWLPSDVTVLVEQFQSGKSFKELGIILGVTPERCRLKLRGLGLLSARSQISGYALTNSI